jgi:hypothetical protein
VIFLFKIDSFLSLDISGVVPQTIDMRRLWGLLVVTVVVLLVILFVVKRYVGFFNNITIVHDKTFVQRVDRPAVSSVNRFFKDKQVKLHKEIVFFHSVPNEEIRRKVEVGEMYSVWPLPKIPHAQRVLGCSKLKQIKPLTLYRLDIYIDEQYNETISSNSYADLENTIELCLYAQQLQQNNEQLSRELFDEFKNKLNEENIIYVRR